MKTNTVVDWNDPESVVRAAVPDAQIVIHIKARTKMFGIVSHGNWLQTKNHRSARPAWKEVMDTNPTVAAFIAANRPEEKNDGE